MQALPNVISIVKFLHKRGLEAITCKFEITSIQKLALFFHPKFKSLQPFSAAEKDEIFVLAKSLLDLVPAESDQNDLRQDHSYIFDLATTSGCLPKKSKSVDDEFVHWQSDSSNKVPAMDEIQMYKQKVFGDIVVSHCKDHNEFGIIQFWSSSEIKTQFSRLRRLALAILSIPASSSPSERAFSVAGNIVTKRRNQLSSSGVKLVFTLQDVFVIFFMLCSRLIMHTTYDVFLSKLY